MRSLSDILLQADWLEARLDLSQALQVLTQAIKQQPSLAALPARRAEVLKNLGLTSAASQDLQAALALMQQAPPDKLSFARTHSRLIMMNWSLASDWEQIAADLRQFRAWHGGKQPASKPTSKSSGPLKIGLLSPDFRPCSAALLLAQVLQHPPAQEVAELVAYNLVQSQDPIQERFQQLVPDWHDLSHLSAEAIAAQMRHDQIDILIDLAGHTSLNGLAVLAQRAAPIQVSGLTFNGPTGLHETDYQLSDTICTPAALLEETPLYLPSWIIWPKPPFAVPSRAVEDLPARGFRLGCAHHPGRLSPQTLDAWSEILTERADAFLTLKHRFYASALCRQTLRQAFAQRGIPAHQVRFEAASDYQQYFAFYQQLDLVLDPFPYHGGLVSCEALWMGLPLVTQAAWMRGGAALLKQVQFAAGIADSHAGYCLQANQILDSLALRQEAALFFRERLEHSPVMQTQIWADYFWQHLSSLQSA